jgi:chemotaxis protein methyltransferase CheR
VTSAIAAADVERFRVAIARRLGLQIDSTKSGMLEELLRRRADAIAVAGDIELYLRELESRPSKQEIAALAGELTVPETYFFRHIEQYRAFTEIVLPARIARRNGSRRLRILSAGCATGEEPYTLAMSVLDAYEHAAVELFILGVDLNPANLERARRGRYSRWSLRETPESDRARWFQTDGREFTLDPVIRQAVRFEQHNLVDDDPRLWGNEPYDVVFCRNVLMYFAPEQAQAVVRRFARLLDAGGFLFLGHAETLRGISNDFHLRHTHATFYYERKDASEARLPLDGAAGAQWPTCEPLVAATEAANTWVDAIRLASERIRELTAAPRTTETARDSRPFLPADLGAIVDLMRAEQFAEALARVEALPVEPGRDPDAWLLRAVLLAHNGDLTRAEEAGRALIAIDDLSAAAHYLLALCREGAGDPEAARHHDQVAAYLDPVFAMPRLHLGLLARRAGDLDTARFELEHALVLLRAEDPARVLLFGGGFSREALVALCRAELVRSGGRA